MWWFALGDLPPGVDAEEPEWTRQVVAWCKGYLEFCCDPPLLGYYVDGIATEDEIAEGTSRCGEMPLGMAFFMTMAWRRKPPTIWTSAISRTITFVRRWIGWRVIQRASGRCSSV